MDKLPNDLEEIKQEIERLSRQIYVERYLEIPAISVIPLQLLNLYLYRSQFATKLRKMIVVITGLIQRGLDMHDQVTNNQELVSERITKRQMQILAGDYYSSICYQIMAEEGFTMHVRKLAKGITKNSAAKMQLYDFNSDNNFESIQELVDLVKVREAALYTEFLTGNLDQTEQMAWKVILGNVILLSHLSEQLNFGLISDSSLAFYLIRYLISDEELSMLYQSVDTKEFQARINQLYITYGIEEKIIDLLKGLKEETYEMIALVKIPKIQKELLSIIKEADAFTR